MSKCFVTNCTSGYKSNPVKVSIFKAPTDPAMLEKWRRVIPRVDRILTSKDRVCEKHFLPKEVIKDWKAEKDGVIVMQGERRAKLSPDAVPSQFPTKAPKSRRRPRKTNFEVSVGGETSEQNAASTVAEETVSNDHEQSSTADVIPVFIEPEKISFQDLRNGASSMRLPSTMWSVHMSDHDPPACISFVCTGFNREEKRMVILKQVCFDEDLNVSAFVLNKAVTSVELGFGEARSTSSLEVVCTIIRALHERSICEGGPKISEYEGVQPETAYVDECGRWRHVRCALFGEEGSEGFQCPACASLRNTFKVHLFRKKKRKGEQKRIRIPQRCSPGEKVRLNILRREKAARGKMLKKSQALTRKLRVKIKNVEEKLGEIYLQEIPIRYVFSIASKDE